MTNDWVAGFFSGEGYFNIQNIGCYKSFSVGITQNIRNLELLNDIKNYLSIGKVELRKVNACHWRIHKQREVEIFCEEIIPHLEGYTKVLGDDFYNKFKKYKGVGLSSNCSKV